MFEFSLYFPRYRKDHNRIEVIKESKITSIQGSETILIVDDEEGLRKLAAEFLSMDGYTVHCADGHIEALEILKNKQIDLMLSDVVMPEMNGYQLSSIVKQLYPSVKIQLVSGHVDSTSITFINKDLHKNLIQKPYSYYVLKNKIRSLLNDKE